MAYATRLGLWGSHHTHYPTFDTFQSVLEKRGVGAMEMLALEMKRKGMFIARTLSWDGARFDTVTVHLTSRQVMKYNYAVKWWNNLKVMIQSSLDFMNLTHSTPKTLWRAYWSAHQRFFREMCICAKIDEVVKQAKEYLKKGDHAVIIGLQSTGEAGLDVAMQDICQEMNTSMEDLELPSLVSTCASIMTNIVRNHFPVALPPPEEPKIPPIPPNGFGTEFDRAEYLRLTALAGRIKSMPPPAPIPELVERRNIILASIQNLDLPPNPLDDIIDRLGGVENVAELTGRSGRILRNAQTGKYHYVKRLGANSKHPSKKTYGLSMPIHSSSDDDDMDRENIVEKKRFMNGFKSVSIISDAASTGISLHADSRCKTSHKRRVHFTIELPWAADKAIQQLGRSHRSGQASAPIYKMVVTSLGGERRFAAAVSKRMANLGALTKGDRRAATGTDLSQFDIDSIFGRRALTRVYTCLRQSPPIMAPSRNGNAILDSFIAAATITSNSVDKPGDKTVQRMSALLAASDGLEEVGLNDRDASVKVFLNRIAGLYVSRQNLVFSLFMSTLDDVIADAKATGEFEGSVEDVKATNIALQGSPEIIATDGDGSQPTMLTKIKLDRGISFDDMVKTMIRDEAANAKDHKNKNALEEEDGNVKSIQCAKTGFYISKRKIAGRFLIMYAKRKVNLSKDSQLHLDPLGLMIITRPNTGKNPCEMRSRDLLYKYQLIVPSSFLLKHLYDNNASLKGDENGTKEKSITDDVGKIREHKPKLCKMWDKAYDESNCLEHNAGLAPRISYMGLITGAVLHILPVLEKAVLFLRHSQRSLRVIRVELTGSGQRLVGIRFPLEAEALAKFKILLNQNALSLKRNTLSFIDEQCIPIDEKAVAWTTTPQKTMKSYFGIASSSKQSLNNNSMKRKEPSPDSLHSPFVATKSLNTSFNKRREPSHVSPHSSIVARDRKKVKITQTKSIASFFSKKT
uniref:Strawberry notch helicase C domain-containing protein n=2 Tax=Ditylum brightwellii TaxID=49249 RepID=A0A6V2EFM3_9STRA